jgi:RimJ/RimL family protein N-acetyltransferase
MSILETTRLRLRPLKALDCNARYLGWLQDPVVNRFLETRFAAQSIASITAFVEAVNRRGDEFLFGMFLGADGRHIGNIKVGPVNPHHRLADVSLFIGERDCWGRGYAAEAIAAVSRHAFGALGVRKLCAGMYAPNVASARAFLRVGYREECRRPAHYLLEGVPCDILELGCTSGDLRDPAPR